MQYLTSALVVAISITVTGCGTGPVDKKQWQAYKSTEYSPDVQIAICQAQAQVASLELQQNLEAQYAQKRQACLAAANSASTTTVNVYGNNTTYNNRTGLSGGLSGTNKAIASYSCNTVLIDNIASGNAVGNVIRANLNACMTKSGFMQQKVCVDRCNGE